jgi:hypothetical protein
MAKLHVWGINDLEMKLLFSLSSQRMISGVPICTIDGLRYAAGVFAKKTCNMDEVVVLDPLPRTPVIPLPSHLPRDPQCPVSGSLRCTEGTCVEPSNLCDVLKHCKDGRDEVLENCDKEVLTVGPAGRSISVLQTCTVTSNSSECGKHFDLSSLI